MNTLSDTPTPTMLTEAGGVSIKIEQGVLYENNHEHEGTRCNTAMRDISIVESESSHRITTVNSAEMSDDNYDMRIITHSISRPDFDIKAETDIDIDDRLPDEEAGENMELNSQPKNTPIIRLTPTSKLIASPNATVSTKATTVSDNKRRYACPYENCTKSYGKSSHLRSHLTWHTGIKPFVCKDPTCGKGFTRSDELNRHIRTHTGEKPFKCVQCTKKFSRSDHLSKHLATHNKQLSSSNGVLTKKNKMEKKPSQDSIKNISPTLPVAENHNQNVKEANLVISNVFEIESTSSGLIPDSLVTETQKGNITITIKLEKSEYNEDCMIATPNLKINVSPCTISPGQRQDPIANEELRVLVKAEPVENSDSNEFPEALNEPNDDDIMPEANLPPLSQNSTIMPPAVKPGESSLLMQTIRHMSDGVYDPSRPFPCCHCSKNFKRQDDLNRHKRTHTGEKPFACNECDKRFMRSDHLKKHLNTHTRVR